ncbi:LysR substrate-binding domain-containing protein, partial [Paraburkholderia sp. SIMBA_054]|uniref:LysR substrate-binding domain-containing protein n=1 Tax=Paraburkholderia sp. SIMBA_054 TaxID=3085795 RepID=UPI0039786384
AEGLRPLAQSLARGEAGVLSLAFVSTADYGLLPRLLREFGARHPRVRLELTEATSDVQVDELVAGRIDAGLVIAPLPSRHAMQLSWLPIEREPLVIAMSTEMAARVAHGGAHGAHAAAATDSAGEPHAEWLDAP